jgi:glycerol kinase
VVLLDKTGKILGRQDVGHEQIINELGWVEHDPIQIYKNVIATVKALINTAMVKKAEIIGVGITNQRETAVVWDRKSGMPVCNAIVWQCARGAAICKRLEGAKELIHKNTGLNLSPYFTAAKIAWVLENIEGARSKSERAELACGTMDSWLVYKLTQGAVFKTDYSNASRTELFNIHDLKWDREICDLFGINTACLAEVCDSNACYGYTDFDGLLEEPIPIHAVLGDSHGALFGQNCMKRGMVKATYGTGSSVMMNIGSKPYIGNKGIVTSLAWGMDGRVEYVLEGNINYTGAVISWLKEKVELIDSSSETEYYASISNPADHTYLVPAFSGLGAPYWNSDASAILCGMTRNTGKAEIVRAALDSIAYQIADIIEVMRQESGIEITELRVDGGPTKNRYLMQFQSNLLNIPLRVPETDELSVIGAAYAAGIALGVYDKDKVFSEIEAVQFHPDMKQEIRVEKLKGWKEAVSMLLMKD